MDEKINDKTTFWWGIHFKGTCLDGTRLDREFKGGATTEKDVDISVMLHELVKFIGKEHGQPGVRRIEAWIRRAPKGKGSSNG